MPTGLLSHFASQNAAAGSVVRSAHLLRKSATPVPLFGPHICCAKVLHRFRKQEETSRSAGFFLFTMVAETGFEPVTFGYENVAVRFTGSSICWKRYLVRISFFLDRKSRKRKERQHLDIKI